MVIDGVVGRTAPRVLDFNKMLGPSKWRALTAALTGLVRQAGRTPSFKVNTCHKPPSSDIYRVCSDPFSQYEICLVSTFYLCVVNVALCTSSSDGPRDTSC